MSRFGLACILGSCDGAANMPISFAALPSSCKTRMYGLCTVLGFTLPVAAIDDVLRGKIWAVQDPGRRSSKRQKDLADIARLLETSPQLRSLVPAEILARLF